MAAIAAFSISAACTLFNSLDEYGPPKPKPTEAGTNPEGGQPDSGPGDDCAKKRPPERPTTDPGGANQPDLIFAIEQISIGGSADGKSIATEGYDLDNNCTCPGRPSCVPPGNDAAASCDLEGGVDSNGTLLLENFIRLGNLEVDTFKRIREGKRGLLFRVRRWNGQPNDPQIEVAVFLTSGTENDPNTGTNKIPTYDGTDKWTLDPVSLLGGGPSEPGQPIISNYVDQNAYVANGVMVAKVDFPLGFSDLILDLTGSMLTARLEQRNGRYRLDDGRLVGRWATNKLLTVLDTVNDPYNPGGGLCGDSGIYADLKKRICGGVDIRSDPSSDGTDKACDALSITTTFAAGPADFGAILSKTPPDHLCGAGYTDDCSK